MKRDKSRGVFCARSQRSRRAVFTTLMGAMAAVLIALPARFVYAHQSPGGCNANRLNASIIKDKTQVYPGDTITYTVTVSNLNSSPDIACDITNATVEVTLPAADGTATGTVVTLASGVDFLAGTPLSIIGSTPYVVAVNPGVIDIVAQVSVDGTLHDAPTDHTALIIKTLGTSVIEPPAPPTGGGGGGGTTTPSGGGVTPRVPNTGRM